MDKDFFNAKTVLIMGLGRFGGGADSALFAHHAGAKVIITDLAGPDELADTLAQLAGCQNIEYHLAGHNQADFGNEGADIIIVNPAVHPDNNFLRIARRTSRNWFHTSSYCRFGSEIASRALLNKPAIRMSLPNVFVLT